MTIGAYKLSLESTFICDTVQQAAPGHKHLHLYAPSAVAQARAVPHAKVLLTLTNDAERDCMLTTVRAHHFAGAVPQAPMLVSADRHAVYRRALYDLQAHGPHATATLAHVLVRSVGAGAVAAVVAASIVNLLMSASVLGTGICLSAFYVATYLYAKNMMQQEKRAIEAVHGTLQALLHMSAVARALDDNKLQRGDYDKAVRARDWSCRSEKPILQQAAAEYARLHRQATALLNSPERRPMAARGAA